MRASDIIGVIGGVVFAGLGLLFAPSPAYDPGGWGYCGVSEAFPIVWPEMQPKHFGFDGYECAIDRTAVVLLLGYLAAVSMIAGALASRIGAAVVPGRGVLAVALAFGPALLLMATSRPRVDVLSSAMVGVAVFIGAAACAYLAGYLAKRGAEQTRMR